MQPPPTATRTPAAPSFYLTGRQPLRPGVILLAIAVAVGALCLFVYAMGHAKHARRGAGGSGAAGSASGVSAGASAAGAGDDDDDDPNQIDTIVLGDPGDAPVPGKKGNHVSAVHPTIVVRLPRTGDQTGMIPDTAAGRLLVGWLAAFNHASASELDAALPNASPGAATAAQLALRQQTGGFELLSAKEVEPGVLVFRLRDQTPAAGEVLGTLRVRGDSVPAAMGSFSLRAVPVRQEPKTGAGPGSEVSP